MLLIFITANGYFLVIFTPLTVNILRRFAAHG